MARIENAAPVAVAAEASLNMAELGCLVVLVSLADDEGGIAKSDRGLALAMRSSGHGWGGRSRRMRQAGVIRRRRGGGWRISPEVWRKLTS